VEGKKKKKEGGAETKEQGRREEKGGKEESKGLRKKKVWEELWGKCEGEKRGNGEEVERKGDLVC